MLGALRSDAADDDSDLSPARSVPPGGVRGLLTEMICGLTKPIRKSK
jgi:hypothetical protein